MSLIAAAVCLWSSVVFGSETFIEPGSEPGWRPADGLEQEASDKMRSVLTELSEESYEQAYWSLDPHVKFSLSEDQFRVLNALRHEQLGAMTSLHIVRVSWKKARPGTGLTGIYAAIDITRTFEHARRDCGYVVLHQLPNDPNWWVLRLDDHVMPDAIYDDMISKGEAKKAEALWSRLKQGCPTIP